MTAVMGQVPEATVEGDMTTRLLQSCLLVALLPACADGPSDDVEPDLEALLDARAGTYEGSFQLSGLDETGQPIPMMMWTDVAVADEPTIDDDRAYLHVNGTSTFADGTVHEQSWIEGYLLDGDGFAGDEFIEMNGVVTVVTELAPDRYQYEQELSPQDFYLLGPVTAENLDAGHHVMDKTVTFPDGIETHDIIRTTHLEWTDEGGSQTLEFESLSGQHRKVE